MSDVRPQSGHDQIEPFSEEDRLLTSPEVAAKFRVDSKTVTRWARAGRIGQIRTPGGHLRYSEAEVRELLGGGQRGDEDPS